MQLAIVTPRYGLDIGGGAETQAREFAEEAVRRAWSVEVWTTCARDHYTWRNDLPAGCTVINGVTVRRFPIQGWDASLPALIGRRLATNSALTIEQQYEWLHSGPHSPALYAYVARHAARLDACVMLPYAAPLVHYAAWAAPARTIVWPCLHHEALAYVEPVRLLLESVGGVMFNTQEEAALAQQTLAFQLQRSAVLGEGVTPLPAVPAVAPGSDLLYIGRLEAGKNVPLLYRYVRRYVEAGQSLRLVVIGSGPITPPRHPAFDFRGFVSEAVKAQACAVALALCQPSHHESFSRVIMESWMAGRPVLVNENCPPTRGHVERSKGGLAFRSYEEFAAAVDWLKANPTLAIQMGGNGQRYVQQNYLWPIVVDRFEQIVKSWRASEQRL